MNNLFKKTQIEDHHQAFIYYIFLQMIKTILQIWLHIEGTFKLSSSRLRHLKLVISIHLFFFDFVRSCRISRENVSTISSCINCYSSPPVCVNNLPEYIPLFPSASDLRPSVVCRAAGPSYSCC